MKRIALMLAVVVGAVGCGDGGGWKETCSPTKQCSAGNYCATTEDGSVCWPDSSPPSVGVPTLECSASPCLRDSTLTIAVTASDADSGIAEVAVTFTGLDDDHPTTRTLQHDSGDVYRAVVPIAELPFPHFWSDVGVSITVKDGVDREAGPVTAGPVRVTRQKWTLALPGQSGTYPLFSPAVIKESGVVVVTGSDGSVHMVNKDGGLVRTVAVGSGVNSPAAIGAGAIWVAGQTGTLYKRALTDGADVALTDCAATGGAGLLGPPAVLGERAVVSSTGLEVLVAKAANSCVPSIMTSSASTSPVVDGSGRVVLATGSVLRAFTVALSSGLGDAWAGVPAPAVGTVTQPLALDGADGSGALWSVAQSGAVYRTTPAGVASPVTSSPSINSTGAIILSDKSAVISDSGGQVRRVGSSGTSSWTTNPSVAGQPAIPLAVTGSEPSLLVPTSDGSVFVLSQSTGQVLWSHKLSPQALQPANIWTERNATTSTAYFAGANGTLYAVIVDGALDTSAPWPKAYHDPQNTSNAGTSLAGATP